MAVADLDWSKCSGVERVENEWVFKGFNNAPVRALISYLLGADSGPPDQWPSETATRTADNLEYVIQQYSAYFHVSLPRDLVGGVLGFVMELLNASLTFNLPAGTASAGPVVSPVKPVDL
jgi:hypothetical protein